MFLLPSLIFFSNLFTSLYSPPPPVTLLAVSSLSSSHSQSMSLMFLLISSLLRRPAASWSSRVPAPKRNEAPAVIGCRAAATCQSAHSLLRHRWVINMGLREPLRPCPSLPHHTPLHNLPHPFSQPILPSFAPSKTPLARLYPAPHPLRTAMH